MTEGRWDWTQVPAEHTELLETLPQRRTLEMLIGGMTFAEIAKADGVARRNIAGRAERIKLVLKRHNYSQSVDATAMVMHPHYLKGQSRLTKHNADGTKAVVLTWDKTDIAKQKAGENLKEFIAALCQDITPAKPTQPAKGKRYNSELMSAIYIGDAHIGAYCWGKETKHSDFDSDIASLEIRNAVDNLVDRSPDSERGLLVDVGDFMHANTSHNTTWSGTPLDVDTRHSRVLRVAGKTMRYCIAKMLQKFKAVTVVIVRGNHNSDAAVAVQEIVSAYFHNEPRVTILETNGFFHYIEWGNWLFGFNHGDKVKPEKLVNIMARDQSAAWGRTTHRMWALGHFHHQDVKELDGCIVQKFAALPPPDGWHSSMGFSSVQAMQMIVFKKSGGKESTLIYELPRPAVEPDLRIA